ncbi:hypothetical protein FB192DRAFT_1466407 [Mucor lusitanicus]|uniref:Homeobox domain-containing protein n=1 Tax=Mucor circinelloides f. lusitanicus TaxID=29924 RepID=A0A8H4EX87_MUCCL|nr:hypothetical protein FB192DRAFT_1466407 [Mucor lusitanicus]
MMQDFPDLSSFVCHPDFNGFARIWLEYQRHIHMAQHPEQRSAVSAWLKMAALQLHFCLVTLVRSSPDRNEEAASMFSAFRRLKDRVEIMHSVITIVENGRLLGQSPLEAIAPLMAQADEIKRNVDYFVQEQNVIPVLNEQTNLVELRDPNQVSMAHLSKDLVSTYNMMPYNADTSALATGTNTPIDPTAVLYEANQNDQTDLVLMSTAAPELTGLQPDAATDLSASATPASFYVPSQQSTALAAAAAATGTNNSANQFGFETPLTQDSTESTPLTIYTIQAPYNTDEELSSFSPTCGSLTTVSPINTLSDDDDADLGQEEEEDCPTPDTDDDDDYSQLSEMEDDDDESGPNSKDLRSTSSRTAASQTTGSQKTRRTATSYDAKTTHYLKSIFFDIYSTRDKLTKDQRRRVQQETGLKPRNITYWFSNHKRRFPHSLNVFKKTVQETQGQVKTYDDFLVYRRLHGLPEEVQDTEFVDDDNKSIDF